MPFDVTLPALLPCPFGESPAPSVKSVYPCAPKCTVLLMVFDPPEVIAVAWYFLSARELLEISTFIFLSLREMKRKVKHTAKLKGHAKHHSPLHMTLMKKEIQDGKTFKMAHRKAMKTTY